MSLQYAWEKCSNAVTGAVSSEYDVQKRLERVIVENVIHIGKEDVPPELWERLQKLNNAVTKENAVADEGRVAATTAKMSADEAKKWLEEIVSIHNDVCELYYGQRDELRDVTTLR